MDHWVNPYLCTASYFVGGYPLWSFCGTTTLEKITHVASKMACTFHKGLSNNHWHQHLVTWMSQEVSKKLVSSGHLLISSDIQVRFLVLSWMMSLVFAGFDLVIPDSWIYERPRCLAKHKNTLQNDALLVVVSTPLNNMLRQNLSPPQVEAQIKNV